MFNAVFNFYLEQLIKPAERMYDLTIGPVDPLFPADDLLSSIEDSLPLIK
jgi:hypothetical protein